MSIARIVAAFIIFARGRTKIISAVLILLVLFAACALLPLSFGGASDSVQEAPPSIARSAELFARYWSDSGENYEISATETVSAQDESLCREYMQGIVSDAFIDEGEQEMVSEGIEFFVLRDEEIEIRLCRAWLETKGDWKNWIDVIFDMDTGFVYYYYFSSGILSGGEKYLYTEYSQMDSETIARRIANETGYALRFTKETTNAFIKDGEVFCVQILYTHARGSLIDITITCVS